MILVRYIIREHIFPFVTAFGVITFLFAINQVLDLLDQVLSKGLPLEVLAELLTLSLAWMLALSIPMSMLVATLLAFSRLSSDHEITALKAAGISPLFLMRPIILIAILISTILLVFNNWILPEANYRAGGLMSSISRKKPTAMLQEGRLINQFPNVQLWIDRIDRTNNTLFGVRIYETPANHPLRMTFADTAQLEYTDHGATLLFHLKNGTSQNTVANHPTQYNLVHFKRQSLAIANVDDRFERRERGYKGDREMNVDTMWTIVKAAQHRADSLTIPLLLNRDSLRKSLKSTFGLSKPLAMTKTDSLQRLQNAIYTAQAQLNQSLSIDSRWKEEKDMAAQYLVEIHKKFSIPFATIAFVLVGAPLGFMNRKKGLGGSVIISLFIFVLFWILLMSGERLGDRRIITPWLAMWSPNLMITPFGFYLCYKMMKDRYSGRSLWSKLHLRIPRLKRSKNAL